jgi:hypothetical protein
MTAPERIAEPVPHAALERSRLYPEELGIELGKNTDRECFRWFLASVLFGARISETIAKNASRAFVRHRLEAGLVRMRRAARAS